MTCGQSSSENCTYFQSNGAEIGQCRIKICPCSDNICQLRLDFQTFVINQPKTSKFIQYKWIEQNEYDWLSAAETVIKLKEKMFADSLQCQTDQFSVTSPGNNGPPVICGTNSGEHSKKLNWAEI